MLEEILDVVSIFDRLLWVLSLIIKILKCFHTYCQQARNRNLVRSAGSLPESGMIIGIGVDIVEIKRFSDALERQGERFLLRLFTPDEQQYCKTKQGKTK